MPQQMMINNLRIVDESPNDGARNDAKHGPRRLSKLSDRVSFVICEEHTSDQGCDIQETNPAE